MKIRWAKLPHLGKVTPYDGTVCSGLLKLYLKSIFKISKYLFVIVTRDRGLFEGVCIKIGLHVA